MKTNCDLKLTAFCFKKKISHQKEFDGGVKALIADAETLLAKGNWYVQQMHCPDLMSFHDVALASTMRRLGAS